MFIKSFASFAVIAACYVPNASAAIVSLYFPPQGAGDVPFTADPIGVDKSGHTTWRYGVGAASGAFTYTATNLPETSATLIEGATDFQAIGVNGATSVGIDCALGTSTASGGMVVASCVGEVAIASVTTSGFTQAPATLTPIPVQVPDNLKSSGAGSVRMSLGGVAVSALSFLGTASVLLVHL